MRNVRKTVCLIVLLLSGIYVSAQSVAENGSKETTLFPLDTIIQMNGDTLIVNVKYKDFDEIIFLYPYNNQVSKITVPTISEMRYSNGMVVYMGNNQKEIKDTSNAKILKNDTAAWQKVKIITKASDLPAKAVNKGEVLIDYTGEFSATDESLEKRSLAVIRKKAIRMNANYVLILNKNIRREYGELPVIEINGVAYWVEGRK